VLAVIITVAFGFQRFCRQSDSRTDAIFSYHGP
jgi:hypothetical protein